MPSLPSKPGGVVLETGDRADQMISKYGALPVGHAFPNCFHPQARGHEVATISSPEQLARKPGLG